MRSELKGKGKRKGEKENVEIIGEGGIEILCGFLCVSLLVCEAIWKKK
jgi:hypothetical protein